MMLILVLLCLFKASTSQVIGSGSSTAQLGEDAHYECKLAPQAGVLQVTWQRVFKDDSIDNLATFSKRYGAEVNKPFTGKVILTEASLSFTAITLKNVTWEDESCYMCSFNTFPDGSKMEKICLTVQGISIVTTSHAQLNSGKEESKHLFSCVATGKPAPTITWDCPDGCNVGSTQTSPVTNADNTFTSSSSIVLTGPAGWSGNVDCVLQAGAQSRRETIYFTGKPKKEKEGEDQHRSQVALVVTIVLIITCIVAAAIVIHKRLKRKAADTEIP